jgi:hypothetical protein
MAYMATKNTCSKEDTRNGTQGTTSSPHGLRRILGWMENNTDTDFGFHDATTTAATASKSVIFDYRVVAQHDVASSPFT